MKRAAVLVSLVAATLLSVAFTASTVFCIGLSIQFWNEAHEVKHGGPAISGALNVLPFLLILTVLGWLSVRWLWRIWRRTKPQPPVPMETESGTDVWPPPPHRP